MPQCVDAEPPVFHNCPQNPIYIVTDEHGQLMPAAFEVPQATDNSGSIAFMRVQPPSFEPPRPVDHDMDVIYTAFDEAGNSAECAVHLRIPGKARIKPLGVERDSWGRFSRAGSYG